MLIADVCKSGVTRRVTLCARYVIRHVFFSINLTSKFVLLPFFIPHVAPTFFKPVAYVIVNALTVRNSWIFSNSPQTTQHHLLSFDLGASQWTWGILFYLDSFKKLLFIQFHDQKFEESSIWFFVPGVAGKLAGVTWIIPVWLPWFQLIATFSVLHMMNMQIRHQEIWYAFV